MPGKIAYIATDIDLSHEEGGKSHVIGEVKSLRAHFEKALLVAQDEHRRGSGLPGVGLFRLPKFAHHPLLRLAVEAPAMATLALVLRIAGYEYAVERHCVGGGWFSVFFGLTGGRVLYQLNEPMFYPEAVANLYCRIMARPLRRAVTAFVMSHLCMSHVVGEEKAFVTHWGADLDDFSAPRRPELRKELAARPENPVAIYVGSAQVWHGLRTIVEAALARPSYSFALLVAGTEQKTNAVKEACGGLRNVRVLANVPRGDIADYVREADVGLAIYNTATGPLARFGYFYSPIKVHEYKAAGKPFVATGIGNLIGLTEGCGLTLGVNNEGLPAALDRLFSETAFYKALSENCLRQSRDVYNWGAVAKNYASLLKGKK